MPRALLLAVVVLAVLAPTTLAASPPRSSTALRPAPDEYPSQGLLLIDTDLGTAACGGTVVSARSS